MKLESRLFAFIFVLLGLGCNSDILTPEDEVLRPPTLVGTYSAGSISLRWSKINDDVFLTTVGSIKAEEYILAYSEASPDALETLRSFDGDQQEFVLEELNNDQVYYFAITAIAKQEQIRSNVIMVIPRTLPMVSQPSLPDSLMLTSDWSQQASEYAQFLWPSNGLPTSSFNELDPAILDSIKYYGGGKYRWSPSRNMLLFEQAIAISDGTIWGHLGIYHPISQQTFALTDTELFFDHGATWSPSSEWIAYLSDEQGGNEYNIWKVRADGSERIALSEDQNDLNELVSISLRSPSALRFSPRGDFIAFERQQPRGDGYVYDLFEIADEGGSLEPLLTSPWNDRMPAYSPSGEQIAFLSDRSGRPEVWLLDSSSGELKQISGGEAMLSPRLQAGIAWSPDGQFLLYLSSMDGELVQVEI